jgi:SAM-dependent methyltransferase
MSKRKRWNERYARKPLVWSAGPNQVFFEQVQNLPPGRALDAACGEGRNGMWLAEQGWNVTGVDFSEAAIAKASQIAKKRGVTIDWQVEDLASWEAPENSYDLVAVVYMHTDSVERESWLNNLVGAVRQSGSFIYIAHDPSNITDGVGGPQEPDMVPGIDEILGALGDFRIEVAKVIERPIVNEPGHSEQLEGIAFDSLIRATRN